MNSPRTLRSPRNAKSADKQRPFVNLFKVDFPDKPAKKIRLPKDMKELLKIATEVLELVRPAKQVFDADNNPITDISSIEPKSNLYISCAEPVHEDDDEPVYKSRLPRNYNAPGLIKLPPVKQPKAKPKREDAVQHQAIAASPYTVKENLRDSLLSLYASLTPEHKAQLNCAPALQKLMLDTKQYVVEDSLLSQFIGPTSVISGEELGKQTTQWMMDRLKGLKPEECRFVITGPSQSGKSTLLSIAASLFYQKLQLSNETSNYLIIPINWLLHQIFLDDIQKIYQLMVTTTLTALRGEHLELIPIMGALQQWLLSLVTIPAFPPLPPSVLHFDPFPKDVVIGIGRRIHDSWNNKEKLYNFLFETMNFPVALSHAFGFKNPVFVFDHFDSCGYVIEPTDRFAESGAPVNISELLCKVIDSCPFFVAAQDESEFFTIFTINEYKQLSTERMITAKGEHEIMISNPQITLSMDMCRGCPAYCAMYKRLCEMVKEANERAAVKSQFSRLRSVVDITRNEMVKQELLRVCLLLAAADTENLFDEEKMNRLSSMPELQIKLR
ncbi:hypothetical protein TRFO_18052 [Tritrichomonas foetus]|uniref:Uncharacterized protein n=1 Tax=Tritrichomonas foetus TaxID=1144522 RepID=A0A1J4KS02_9EUKA|nr:hypothetical protein TRFO_18052 [Tritrichomonas foetus]|eukprot:OHT12245.1 hypothetical protein TRFO_18052 [Tritrichomonas foetus]